MRAIAPSTRIHFSAVNTAAGTAEITRGETRRPRLNVQARTARQHPDGRPDGVAGWVGRVGRTHAEELGEGRTLSCAPFDRCGVPDETQGSVPRCSEISHGPNPADAILAFPVKVYLYGLRGPSRSAKTVS